MLYILGNDQGKRCVRCVNLLEQLRRLDKLMGYGRLTLTTNGILSLQLTYFMAYLNFFVFAAVNHLPFKEGMKHCLGKKYIITNFETEKDLLGKLELLLLLLMILHNKLYLNVVLYTYWCRVCDVCPLSVGLKK